MRGFVLLALLPACSAPDAAGPGDEVVDTDAADVDTDPVAADTGDTGVEDASEALVPFHGASCPADPGWDAADPCGDVAGCDLLVFRISCALVRGRYPIVAAVRDQDGWRPLLDLSTDDPEAVLASIVELAGLPRDASVPGPVIDDGRCSRADLGIPEVFEFTPQGVYTTVAHWEHVACARVDAPGTYGPVGYVQVPIREACVEELTGEPGWAIVDEPGGGHALRTHVFGLERVYAGFFADL